ncbi:MAG: glutaredoxin family protein [Rubrobacteraceae bacterium]|nr:glutaredoxin family protein [Rubrobacteraceae bacterium]
MVEITLLTQKNCAFCEQAKEVLKRLSDEYPISVRELDLATPEGQRLAWHGGVMFPPGIFVVGDPFSYGRPSEKKLRRELERRLAQGDDRP